MIIPMMGLPNWYPEVCQPPPHSKPFPKKPSWGSMLVLGGGQGWVTPASFWIFGFRIYALRWDFCGGGRKQNESIPLGLFHTRGLGVSVLWGVVLIPPNLTIQHVPYTLGILGVLSHQVMQGMHCLHYVGLTGSPMVELITSVS